MDKRIIFHLPWMLWLGVIFSLSFIPGDQLPILKFDWFSLDTIVHFAMYFGLSILFCIGFLYPKKDKITPQNKKQKTLSKNKMNLSNFKLYGVLILIGIAIGYSVELIQGNFIYKRYFGIEDIVANSFGTIFGVIAFNWIGRKLI